MTYSINLKKYVPQLIYENNKEMQAIYDAQKAELDRLVYYIEDIKNQFNINTATWGLNLWEEAYGIKTKYSYSYEERRKAVKAKERGQGIFSKETAIKIGNTYASKTELIENIEPYWFALILESYEGFPQGLDSFYEIIDELKPAHLCVKYDLVSVTQGEFYVSGVNFEGEIITTYPWTPSEIENSMDVFIPMTAYAGAETITTYPKEE
ncbi:putative phage tail protein [Clostridium sp. YIM B02555]|uniref:putative phage tail protein n=1 Tax=Clostridium sp. YIM B02555 TaxID=2911968 RepID=UPI001EEF522C|nr:putative phage tail protein [Clostridium sp. YIM B02555]